MNAKLKEMWQVVNTCPTNFSGNGNLAIDKERGEAFLRTEPTSVDFILF